jgi:soluble lytic murein transglycosylase-like protein
LGKKLPLFFLIPILFSILVVPDAQCSLSQYVRKYKHVKATPHQLQKLAKYDHLIQYFSSFAFFRPKHRVNPDFIRSLILAESNANPRARSSKNARGLTQIIYPTGRLAARDLNSLNKRFRYVNPRRLANLQPDDLYDPAINILLACYLISKYNYNFNGKLDLVVAAWNAGENSIKGNRPPQYTETLDLIGKVNGYFTYFLKRKKQGRIIVRRRS